MDKLVTGYINFIESEKKTLGQKVLWSFLYGLSLIYGLALNLRNLAYDWNFLPQFKAKSKIICVGNLSWAGAGKTTLALYLYEKLSSRFKTAIIRRGYGNDENQMIKQSGAALFIDKNRVKLAKQLENKFDLLIMDDGFGYRKLMRDLNIVVMASREFSANPALIPASYFREPIYSLTRAQILLITHSEQINDLSKKIGLLEKRFPHLKIFTSNYAITSFTDLNGSAVSLDQLQIEPCAGLCAIGYPQSFFTKIKQAAIKLRKEIILPDHKQLSEPEFIELEKKLLEIGVKNLIISAKDKFHFPDVKKNIKIVVMNIRLNIIREAEFLKTIQDKLC